MKMEVVDEERYSVLRGRAIDSAYLFKKNYWICTSGDLDIICSYKMGILTLGVGLSEYESKDTISIVGKASQGYGLPKIKFTDVMRFMAWSCEDYWDQ
jgi:hypothetical protein